MAFAQDLIDFHYCEVYDGEIRAFRWENNYTTLSTNGGRTAISAQWDGDVIISRHEGGEVRRWRDPWTYDILRRRS